MTSASERFRRPFSAWLAWSSPLGIALALFLWAPTGRAEEPDAASRTVARELARQGADAFDQGDYAAALDRLNRAYTLFKAPSISVMQARALARVGRLVEALDKYEETQRLPLASDAPDAFRRAATDAKREGDELKARIPRLAVHVRSQRGIPPGLSVRLDGKPLPAALLDVDRPIDVGSHEIIATAPGYHSVTRSVTLSERGSASVEIDLKTVSESEPTSAGQESRPPSEPSMAIEKAQPGAADTSSRPTAPPARSTPERTWGWTFVGIGAAGLAASAVTGFIALGKKKTLDANACRSGCGREFEKDIDTFRAMRTVSYVSAAVGVASVGVGGYLLLSGSRESAHVAATIGPGSAGLVGAF
jgi:hypothetical protein